MLHIAICDDQPQELETIGEYTKEYIDSNRADAGVKQQWWKLEGVMK